MRLRKIWIALLALAIPAWGLAQSGKEDGLQWNLKVDPLAVGFRVDDNAFRSVVMDQRWTDEIYSANWGGRLQSQTGIFTGSLAYHLGMDRYLEYSELDNFKHAFSLDFSANPGDLSISYANEFFARSSLDADFNYQDDNNLVGVQWTPPGPWNYEIRYKNSYRQYYDLEDSYQSRNFTDQAVLLGIQREIDDGLSVKLEAHYNNRQFNRFALNNQLATQNYVQSDQTLGIGVNAHVYFDSILQDFNLEQERTLSNSYGFTNTVYSFSWAAIVRPVSSLYLELFVRLYYKNYDQTPLEVPDEQLGFIDEEGEGLLSAKASWDFDPQWSAGISVSRVRNENTQPGEYYIKNLLSAQLRRSF